MASDNKTTKESSGPPLPPWLLFTAGSSMKRWCSALPNLIVPPELRVIDIGFAFVQTHVLYALCKLGVPDALKSGPKTAAELAPIVGADPEKLFRVLRVAGMYGFFGVKVATDEFESQFFNNAISEQLLSSSSLHMKDWLQHLYEEGTPAWQHLLYAMQHPEDDGATAWLKYSNGKDIWDFFTENPASMKQFSNAMRGSDALGLPGVLADYPWGTASRFVDIGGAHGSVLAALMQQHPTIPGVLFDLPGVVESAQEVWNELHSDLLERISFVGGDFFKPETLPKAEDGDVFIFRWILHDWSDKKAAEILRSTRKAFGDANGKIVIVEANPEMFPRLHAGNLMDLHMMVMLNGKERSQQQWEKLFRETGWTFHKSYQTRGAQHITEAVPAAFSNP